MDMDALPTPEQIAQAIRDAEKSEAVNYAAFRKTKKRSWREIWDFDNTLAWNTRNILNRAVLLPRAKLHLPIITAYALLPSAMCNKLPILFCVGPKGSGKSETGQLIAHLHHGNLRGQIKGSSTTFAALRNHLQRQRWIDEEADLERNCTMVWDDIKRSTLANDPNIYSLIRSGYDRDSDTIEIASKEAGESMVFRTFSPKVLSTIEPFYSEARFSELQRRIVVITHKPFESFTLEEKQECETMEGFDIKRKLALKALNWEGMEEEFHNYWKNAVRLEEFSELQGRLLEGKFDFPDSIKGENWEVSVDLITTGVIAGVWGSPQDAINHFGDYWQWFRENIESSFGATHRILRDLIDEQTALAKNVNLQAGYEAVPLAVEPKTVKERLKLHADRGELDTGINTREVTAVMLDLGWKLQKVQGRMQYAPANR